MAKILVTGGLGFIGSHSVVELQNEGFEVSIIDDLSNSSLSVLDGISKITGKVPNFHQFDLKDKSKVQTFFKANQDIKGIVHFAASKAVGDSVKQPLAYYENNVNPLIYLLQEAARLEQVSFIFSSSCTVYGQADILPITETAPIQTASSPYGSTKQIGETITRDTCERHTNVKAIALRYFNPIGAHKSAYIGELPIGTPQNLVPFITQTAIGIQKELAVFGNDYPTADGTCVRDYIHVVDLAKAHVTALQHLLNSKQSSHYDVFNIGTGQGRSVLEIITTFENVSNKTLPYTIVNRRSGDVASAYADTTKANTKLGWTATLPLHDAIQSAWKWQQKIVNK